MNKTASGTAVSGTTPGAVDAGVDARLGSGVADPRRFRILPWSLGSIALLLAAWQLAALRLPPIILPSIDSTAIALARLLVDPATWLALGESLGSYLSGFAIAAALGTVIGVTTGLSPAARSAFAPFLALLGSVPTVAWMGLAMIWFGLGMGPTVFLVVVTTTPILVWALARAVADRDQRLEELADVFELSPGLRLRHVTIPPLIGTAQAALVAMAGLGWKLTVMGEFLTASRGLGELLVEAKAHLQTDRVIAITVLLVFVWVVVDLVLRAAATARPARAGSRIADQYAEAGSAGRPDPDSSAATAETPRPIAPGSEHETREAAALLRCVDVSLGYDSVIAHRISFAVRPGCVIAVLGASGIGKSSLLNVLGGLRVPLEGSVERRGPVRAAYVFQEDRLLPWRTVEQNVSLLTGSSQRDTHAQLEALGLAEAAHRMPHELSGGMRRRVALARGFLRDAELLLLDEPFAGLDPLRRAALIDDIEQLRRTRGRAIVFVTHDVDDAILLADEALVLGAPSPVRPAIPAEVVARVDLSGLGPTRSAGDPASASLRARLLAALLGETPAQDPRL